ncbi:hypothetical protein SYJ56_05000 [Algoriphagus sp. D3-2-R+10]|uniref:hypothetical protein n=1 Tax=Algoriphagus aurantiacus TaxID=3103948 RepID=UPI002B3DE3EF|nr:hypothetical protein [Algoriphagus sp. D3-2-R+10]MEB2774652.1 hypothetical protein [Algoriphagus sp. D3-2-R+10]
MKKQDFLPKVGFTILILINLVLKSNSVMSQSNSEVIDFKINYKQESLDKSNKSKNTVEVNIDTEHVKDASKYFIKLARISDLGAEDIYQKVIDIKEVKSKEANSTKDEGFILTDRELIFIINNIPGDKYEVFVRIDNTKGESFTHWKEIVLEGN